MINWKELKPGKIYALVYDEMCRGVHGTNSNLTPFAGVFYACDPFLVLQGPVMEWHPKTAAKGLSPSHKEPPYYWFQIIGTNKQVMGWINFIDDPVVNNEQFFEVTENDEFNI